MKNITRLYSYCLFAAAFTYPAISQAVVWTGLGDGSSWLDGSNWDTGVPGAGDSVTLSGATVNVGGAGATYNQFANSAGTVEINSGGVLTQVGVAASAIRYITNVNINDGGTFIADPGVNLRVNTDIASGGTLEGTIRIRDSRTLNVGGVFRPGDNLAVTEYLVDPGTINLTSTGVIELDIFGNSSGGSTNNDHFASSGTLNISTGTIQLVLQGYTPSIGDSWDLWDGSGVTTGATIAMTGYTFDLSQWVSDGIVTIDAVVAVPEPSTYAFILGFGVFGLFLMKRRRS